MRESRAIEPTCPTWKTFKCVSQTDSARTKLCEPTCPNGAKIAMKMASLIVKTLLLFMLGDLAIAMHNGTSTLNIIQILDLAMILDDDELFIALYIG